MRVKFKEKCLDKTTGELYIPGMERDFKDERAEEILTAGGGRYAETVPLVDIAEPSKEECKKKTPKTKKK